MTVALTHSTYARMVPVDLHRERARLLRIVLLHRWMEMRAEVISATERTVEVIKPEADISTFESVLQLDNALEQLATDKERA